jgi:hypothetical protein
LEGIHQAKALFPDWGDHSSSAWQWLIGASGGSARPVYALNRLSIGAGWGAIFCSLAAGAGRRAGNTGRGGSHDTGTATVRSTPIDSG